MCAISLRIAFATLVLLTIVFPGCARTLDPVTTGFHAPIDPNAPKNPKVVVWGNHAGMVNAIIGWVQQGGATVVERARLQEVFEEQKIRLTHTTDDEAGLLKVGRLIGADHVIFAEATVTPATSSRAYVGSYGGGAVSETVYHVGVAVRGVAVESGEVRWSGTAHYPGPINNPEQGIVYLAQSAIARALCRVEVGYTWTKGNGCVK